MINLSVANKIASMSSAQSIGGIPVRNIWLLMLYASDLYRELPASRRTDVEDVPDDIPNLVAELLIHAVERRLRRNLTIGYQRQKADLNRVRGRIAILRTERYQLLRRGRIACSFDELTVDTPRNRFVMTALLHLAGIVKDVNLSRTCRVLATTMGRAGVSRDPVSGRHIHHLPPEIPGRLGAEDRQMMAAARLAFDLALPNEDQGKEYIATPDRQEYWVRQLFERAVGGFYEVVLPRGIWRVFAGRRIHLPVETQTPGLPSVLPSMKTDIELERYSPCSQPHRFVIDTKFTSILKPGYYREQTLRSGYIYQIYTYIKSQESDLDPLTLSSTAVLLHPAIDIGFDEAGVIQGHEFRFLTVDLAADSQTIRQQLLRVVSGSTLSI